MNVGAILLNLCLPTEASTLKKVTSGSLEWQLYGSSFFLRLLNSMLTENDGVACIKHYGSLRHYYFEIDILVQFFHR